MMSEYEDDAYTARVARQRAQEMVATKGWMDLAQWVTERAAVERDYVLRGAGSWDEYQRAIGRLSAFEEVLDRPAELVELADKVDRGDTE